jgi:hypothetical protein
MCNLLHYGNSSRNEGSISGSNSSVEISSVGWQPSVRRQKVVPTQKTHIPTPPRSIDHDHPRSPRQHISLSQQQSLVSERRDLVSESREKSDGDVICLDDEGGEDVICLLDDEVPVGESGNVPNQTQCQYCISWLWVSRGMYQIKHNVNITSSIITQLISTPSCE